MMSSPQNRAAIWLAAWALCALYLVAPALAEAQSGAFDAASGFAGSAGDGSDLTYAKSLLPFDSLINSSMGSYQSWVTSAVPYASSFFWFWALMEFIWKMWGVLINGAVMMAAIGTAMRTLVAQSLWFGALTMSPQYLMEVPAMFQQIGTLIAAGTGGSGGSVMPQELGNAGLEAFEAISNRIELSGDGLLAALLAFAVLILFAMIGIVQTLMILEAHFVVGAGAIMLGFAGSSWTRGKAISYLSAVVGSGMQLMAMELLLGLLGGHIKLWQDECAKGESFTATAAALLGLLMVFKLVVTLPGSMSAIARGAMSSGMSGGAAGSMNQTMNSSTSAAVGTAVGGAVALGGNAGVAIKNAFSDLSDKMGKSGGRGGGGSGGGAESAALNEMRAEQSGGEGAGGGAHGAESPNAPPVSGAELDSGE